jgi:hypothetical protein
VGAPFINLRMDLLEQAILADLQLNTPEQPDVTPPFYRDNDTPAAKVKMLLRQYRRTKSLNNRIEKLLVMWYIGEVVENVASDVERKGCIQVLTDHQFKLAKKVYYLYELLGPKQIVRTQQTTVTMIHKLKVSQFQTLVQHALAIAGARN